MNYQPCASNRAKGLHFSAFHFIHSEHADMIRVYNEIANQYKSVFERSEHSIPAVFNLFSRKPYSYTLFSFLYTLHMLFVFGAVLVRQLVNVRKSFGKD